MRRHNAGCILLTALFLCGLRVLAQTAAGGAAAPAQQQGNQPGQQAVQQAGKQPGQQTDRQAGNQTGQRADSQPAGPPPAQSAFYEESVRLNSLALILQTQVQKSSKDQLSLDVIRTADEIERTAHRLRLRMKGK
jgi:hypothetical protein